MKQRPRPYNRLETMIYGIILCVCIAGIGIMLAWRV